MNKMVNKYLLTWDKFMPEIHLIHSGFTNNACGLLTKKNKESILTFKETGDSRYVYQNKLDKACFWHDMAYGDFKDLTRRTASDKILCHKAFNIGKSPKYNRYKRGLAAKFYNLFDKKTLGGTVKNENISNKESVEELHKPITKR